MMLIASSAALRVGEDSERQAAEVKTHKYKESVTKASEQKGGSCKCYEEDEDDDSWSKHVKFTYARVTLPSPDARDCFKKCLTMGRVGSKFSGGGWLSSAECFGMRWDDDARKKTPQKISCGDFKG